MIRFFLIVSFLVVSGYALLSAISPELAGNFVFFVFAIVLAAVILKISLDFYLTWREDKTDDSNNSSARTKIKPIYNLEGYRRAVRKRKKSS